MATSAKFQGLRTNGPTVCQRSVSYFSKYDTIRYDRGV